MNEKFLDLKAFMNDRTFYSCENEGEKSEHNFWWDFYSCTDIFHDFRTADGIGFRFEKNERENDNVQCANQIVDAGGFICDKIALAGFCCWGYFQETFLFEFAGATEERAIWLSDLVYSMRGAREGFMEMEYKDYSRSAEPFAEIEVHSSTGNNKGRLYYAVLSFPEKRALKRIVFPDNKLMSIMGITLIES